MTRLELIGVVPPPGEPGPRIHPAMLRTRSPVCRALIAAHALAPEQAVPFQPGPADVAEFAMLRKAGVVREAIAGQFWLDLVANHLREQQAARVRAMWAVGLAAIVVVFAMLLYRG